MGLAHRIVCPCVTGVSISREAVETKDLVEFALSEYILLFSLLYCTNL